MSRDIRYYMIILSLIVSFVSALAAGLLVAIFLFDLFVLKNGWCGHICPLYGVHSIIGKRSEVVSMAACTNCGRCVDVCDDEALRFHIRNYLK